MSLRIEEPLVSVFKEIPSRSDPSFREGRSAFLKEVGKRYFELKQESAVLKSDRYLFQAERVVRNETFQDHPGSLQRLIPLARRYLANYDAFARILNNEVYRPMLMVHSIVALVDAHLQFAHRLTEEIKRIAPFAKTCISITHPKTVDAFHRAGRALFIASDPEEFAAMLDASDPSLFLDIPRYVLLELYTAETPVLPEIFCDCAFEIAAQKQKFEALGPDEQESLFEGAPTTMDAVSLYREMSTTLAKVGRGSNAQSFNTVMNLTFIRLQNDGQMLRAFKAFLATHDLPNTTLGLLTLLLNLPGQLPLRGYLSQEIVEEMETKKIALQALTPEEQLALFLENQSSIFPLVEAIENSRLVEVFHYSQH